MRSRSLAMHRSDELQEVVNSMFERLKDLEIKLDTANILIFSEGTKDLICWVANNSQMYSNQFSIPHADITVLSDIINAKETGQELLAESYSVEEKNEMFEYFFTRTDFKYISEDRKKQILESKQYALSIFLKNVALQITSYSKPSFSDNENEILKRFAKSFRASLYALSRPAKSRSAGTRSTNRSCIGKCTQPCMSMHKSEEFREVIELICEKLTHFILP